MSCASSGESRGQWVHSNGTRPYVIDRNMWSNIGLNAIRDAKNGITPHNYGVCDLRDSNRSLYEWLSATCQLRP